MIRILDEAVIAQGSAPEFIRSDNGPEFVAVAVQDWIRAALVQRDLHQARQPTAKHLQRELHSRFRDEFLKREAFASVLEAKVLGNNTANGTTKTVRTHH